MESWIEVIDGYKVSNLGEVYSTKTKENLEMCNNKYNCNYGSRRNVLSKAVIQETLDGNFVKEWASTREIEQTLGFSNTSISACCRGFAKDYHSGKVYPVHQAFGYKWKYKNNE